MNPPQIAHRRIQQILFVLVLIGHGYFYNGSGWNQNARLDTVYALVEPGHPDSHTFRIDRFLVMPAGSINTCDWARYQGRYYSNKAPGTPLLAAPIYALLFHGERALGLDPRSFTVAVYNAYVINLFVSCFWTALAAVFLFRLLAVRLGYSLKGALGVTLIYAFGTLVFPYDTQFWGHPTAAAFLILGHYFLLDRSAMATGAAGFLLGIAVLCEYMTGLSLPLAAVYLLVLRRGWPAVLSFGGGAAVPLFALLLFHKLTFGGWLVTAASLTNPALEGDRFGAPSLAVLEAVLFSLKRGVLLFSPVLLMMFATRFRLLREPRFAIRLLCLANVAAYLLLIASYEGWHGGLATGPRYLIVAMPFWCLLLPDLRDLRLPTKIVFGLLAAISFVQMLAAAAVEPMVHPSVAKPLAYLLGRLWDGDLKERGLFFYEFMRLDQQQAAETVFNLGRRVFGLEGLPSLLPWIVIVMTAVAVMLDVASTSRRARATPADGDPRAVR